MKILFLSDVNSIHTQRWANGLSSLDLTIGIWSISKPTNESLNFYNDNVKIFSSRVRQSRFGLYSKMLYLTQIVSLKKTIKKFKPNIVHAHYASSFGLLGALSSFKPLIISVWGSDIYDFPRANTLCKQIIKFSLNRANTVLSTSEVMALETSKYCDKQVIVTPFGIDLNHFKKINKTKEVKSFIIGTVKTLERKYGIEYLLKAFSHFNSKYPKVDKKLIIVGEGTLRSELEKLAETLEIKNITSFIGKVPYSDVPKWHQLFDVCVCLSISDSESFGVAAIEASAVSNPVIVSDADGLKEVIKHNETGIVISRRDHIKASDAIEKLFLDPSLRQKMGNLGRERVERHYDWSKNLKSMRDIYINVYSGK